MRHSLRYQTAFVFAIFLLSISSIVAAPSVRLNPSTGWLSVGGSSGNDSLTLEQQTSGVRVTIEMMGRSQSQTFPNGFIKKVSFSGEAGNDSFRNDSSIPSSVNGGPGDDTLRGGTGIDLIRGGDGADFIFGGDGDDRLTGDEGDDQMDGGDGNDHVYGSSGDDVLSGGQGNDSVEGGDDHDQVHGNEGNDTVKGGDGNDTLHGGDGIDRLLGGRGDDVLEGDAGDDELRADDGADIANGGEGNDFVHGGAGNDFLDGGAGDDRVEGYDGDDQANGGEGNDRLRGGDGVDHLFGGPGDDQVYGQGGNDLVYGEDGNDYVSGDDGDDVVRGGEGDDFVRGEEGDDLVYGEGGIDRVQGDDGNDILLGGDGADHVRGGRDRDLLIGGPDADELFGEWGDDILIGSVTLHDDDPIALREIMTVWGNASLSYLERAAALVDSEFSGFLNSGETVIDDEVLDHLTGRSEQDWFFLPGGAHHSGVLKTLDILEDFSSSNEIVNSNVPHPTNPVMRQEHFALFDLVRHDEVTSVAVGSGAWSDASVWSDGIVPPTGARVMIPEGMRVMVDRERDEVLHTVRVDGILEFDPQVDTGLVVDTMIVTPSGALIMGTEEFPVDSGVTASIAIADRGPIDRDWDPFAFSRGIVNHGRGAIYGAMKTPWLALAEIPLLGTETLTLKAAPTNWQVGDSIVIAGSRQNESEERVIRNIQGAVITVDPLQFDHNVPKAGLEIHVVNLSRNVVIFSESQDLDRRGHLMFMHTRNVDVNYAGFYGLGRSDKKVVVNDVEVDGDGVLIDGTGTNPRGRYSVHFHRNGVHQSSEPSRVHGSVVVDSPGWGFVNHSSYVTFSDNVAYNVDGAAFVTEAGDEIGSFVGNLAIHSVGSGQGDETRNDVDDFGHGGDGYWFQGGGVSVTDNVAVGQAETGFIFFTRAISQPGLGKTRFVTENLRQYFSDDVVQEISQGHATVDVRIVPIVDYHHNVAYASRVGSKTKWHQLTSTHGQTTHIHDLLLWGNGPITLSYEYSANIHFEDIHLIGNLERPIGKGGNPNTFAKRMRFTNMTVEGFSIGLEIPQREWSVVEGGFYNNLRDFDVQSAVSEGRQVLFTGDIQFGDLGINKTQTHIEMRLRLRSRSHAFLLDQTTLDFGPFSNQRLYYAEQRGDFVVFPEPIDGVDPSYVGKSNQELWDEFGLALGGEIAPADVIEIEGINGLLVP